MANVEAVGSMLELKEEELKNLKVTNGCWADAADGADAPSVGRSVSRLVDDISVFF